MSTDSREPPRGASCAGCPGDRRSFLRHAGATLAALALSLTGSEVLGADFIITTTRAVRRGRTEVSFPIPAGDGAQIDRDNEVIVVRYQGKAYVFNLSCPHQRTALRWQPEDNQFQCPKHHSRYTPDGVFISGRATRSMDRFGVRREGGAIVADLDRFYRQDEHPAEWEAAYITV